MVMAQVTGKAHLDFSVKKEKEDTSMASAVTKHMYYSNITYTPKAALSAGSRFRRLFMHVQMIHGWQS